MSYSYLNLFSSLPKNNKTSFMTQSWFLFLLYLFLNIYYDGCFMILWLKP
ncbi:hypothetical protein J546_1581 [Acinetobacter sp. 1461402]|nr:hypothetical protein J546_1581 [Acinetobacter sp. 1461402]